MTTSWVITNKATGEVIMETFSEKTAKAVNTEKYVVTPILEHLVGLSRSIKEGEPS